MRHSGGEQKFFHLNFLGGWLLFLTSTLPVSHAFLARLPTSLPWSQIQNPAQAGATSKFQLKDIQDSSQASRQDGTTPQDIFDEIVMSRNACKKFQRYDGNCTVGTNVPLVPSKSNPSVVAMALHCLKLAQRAPSSFNTQPYKVVLVHSQKQKQKMSRYALGPNEKRVLDSDCTAIFLADREVMRTLPKFLKWQLASLPADKQPNRKSKFLLLFYITLFSSGYPLPRFLAGPISFLVRMVFSVVEFLSSWFYVLPSFSSAETWATKNVLPVAMTYMLACTSRGLATCPMEGINAAGIRRALKIPRRYSIPLIVTTGIQYQKEQDLKSSVIKAQDAFPESPVNRYPNEEMIFCNKFGESPAMA